MMINYHIGEKTKSAMLIVAIAFFSCQAMAAENPDSWDFNIDARPLIYVGCGASILLAGTSAYINHNRLQANEPSILLGLFGFLWGGYTTALGVALVADSPDDLIPIGVATAVAGGISSYFGFKEIIGVRAKKLAEKEVTLAATPILMNEGKYGAFVGIKFVLTY